MEFSSNILLPAEKYIYKKNNSTAVLGSRQHCL